MPGDEIDMQIREQGWDWEYILYINGEEQKKNISQKQCNRQVQ